MWWNTWFVLDPSTTLWTKRHSKWLHWFSMEIHPPLRWQWTTVTLPLHECSFSRVHILWHVLPSEAAQERKETNKINFRADIFPPWLQSVVSWATLPVSHVIYKKVHGPDISIYGMDIHFSVTWSSWGKFKTRLWLMFDFSLVYKVTSKREGCERINSAVKDTDNPETCIINLQRTCYCVLS